MMRDPDGLADDLNCTANWDTLRSGESARNRTPMCRLGSIAKAVPRALIISGIKGDSRAHMRAGGFELKGLDRANTVGGHPTPFMISVQERPIKPGDPGDHGVTLADCTHMSMQAGIICF